MHYYVQMHLGADAGTQIRSIGEERKYFLHWRRQPEIVFELPGAYGGKGLRFSSNRPTIVSR